MMNRYVNARTAGVLLLSLLLLLLTGCARSPVLLESTKASLTPQTELRAATVPVRTASVSMKSSPVPMCKINC